MVSLMLSIISSMLLAVSFKVLENLKINAFQAIVFNYFMAATLGFVTAPVALPFAEFGHQPWFFIAFALGFIFILILNIISLTTQKLGITVAGVANKMSIVIPVGVAILSYGDRLTLLKGIGLLLALVAVFLTSKKDRTGENKEINKSLYFLPMLIFFGSGLIDASVNYAQRTYLTDNSFPLFLSTIFGTAGIVGTLTLGYELAMGKQTIEWKAIVSGLIIGSINYASMYFIIRSLNEKLLEPSKFFPVNNMGILALSALVATFAFKEKLNLYNKAGIALALVSIFLIAFS